MRSADHEESTSENAASETSSSRRFASSTPFESVTVIVTVSEPLTGSTIGPSPSSWPARYSWSPFVSMPPTAKRIEPLKLPALRASSNDWPPRAMLTGKPGMSKPAPRPRCIFLTCGSSPSASARLSSLSATALSTR